MAQYTILIVDDDADFRRAITAVMQRAGFRTLGAESGIDALRLIRDVGESLDLLLADIRMPGEIDGIDVAEFARKAFPTLPVVLMSGSEDLKARRPHIYGFLSKPFRPDVLLNAVETVLTARHPVTQERDSRLAVAGD
ncbi:MAG: response regulator [Acidobacteriia bacterium]|nr:response regulator [Terriglobia bacterium]